MILQVITLSVQTISKLVAEGFGNEEELREQLAEDAKFRQVTHFIKFDDPREQHFRFHPKLEVDPNRKVVRLPPTPMPVAGKHRADI